MTPTVPDGPDTELTDDLAAGASLPWEVIPAGATVDVVPGADEIEHDLDDTCACQPRYELVRDTDGGDGWVRIHHAWDRRTA